MSAPSFAIPVAPHAGHPATSKRGAATSDADFAAILDETAPTDAPARSPAPATPKSVVEVTDDAPAEIETAVEGTTVAAPVPLIAPAPPVVLEVAVVEAAPALPTAEAPAAPSDDLAPSSADIPTPSAAPALEPATANPSIAEEKAPVPVAPSPGSAPASASVPAPAPGSADLPDLAAIRTEQSKAAAPTPAAAPAVAPVTPPAPRPAKPAVDVAASEASTETASTDEAPGPATPAVVTPAAPVEAPRTRDAIDRAQATRADASGNSAAADATPSSDGEKATAPTATASVPTPSSRPAPASEAAATPIGTAAAPDATTPLAAPPQATEARPAETALSLALSTTSRASIETTAQIAAQIVRKLEGRSTRFEMTLAPDGLGQVDVSLDIDAEGRLAARMAFDNPLAATELRGRVEELRRQLQEAGFTVADDALSFAERDASAGQQGGSAFDRRPDPRNARAFGAASRLEADADRLLAPARWIPLTLTPDRVDMKV